MERVILHIDMNAFFAAVEQQARPELRGRPVAVTGGGQRTIITTASYEARRFGVKTGMTLYQARRCCPELVLVVGNNRLYTDVSRRIVEVFRQYTPLVEVFSIDEAFLDVSGCLKLFGPPERIAYRIKAQIRHHFGLTCSIGIAPNKLLAKLASEMHKPDGLTRIRPAEVAGVLEHLPVGELCGIGKQTVRQLELLGIRSCGELGRASERLLRRRFGIVGPRLGQMGRGRDDSPVVPESQAEPVKSVGHSMTYDRDISDPGQLRACLLELSEMVGRRARRYGVTGRTLTVTVRYADFTTFSTQESGSDYINRSDALYALACRILERLQLMQPVRLLGVRLTGLRHAEDQLSLFPEENRRNQATAAMDVLNARHGNQTLTFASLLGHSGRSRVISPAWRPEGIRQVEVD